MQVVIDIDDDLYTKLFDNGDESIEDMRRACVAIRKGTPLPKGHGDLITKEQAIELVEFYQLNPQHFDFGNLMDEIKNEKPIIPAENDGEE